MEANVIETMSIYHVIETAPSMLTVQSVLKATGLQWTVHSKTSKLKARPPPPKKKVRFKVVFWVVLIFV